MNLKLVNLLSFAINVLLSFSFFFRSSKRNCFSPSRKTPTTSSILPLVSYTNKFSCSVFKKPGKLPTHWKSEVPTNWKRNCIIGALHRAKRISTDFDKDIKTLENSFINAGYSKRFISHTINTFLNDSSQDDNIIPNFLFEERKKVFIKLPFCGKNEKLSKTFIAKLNKFTNFKFIFIILWQTRQIKSLFNNIDKNTHRSKVVYKGDCSCGVDYIGETVSSTNRQFSRWRHLTTTTTIQFVFLFIFKFCIPSGVKITIVLINMRQAKPEGFWYL